jgi:hypothetical protein
MKFLTSIFAVTVLVAVLLPGPATAFECPGHFIKAQAAIDKVIGDMKGEMSKSMARAGMKAEMALVHAMLDDAKMRLAGAKHNHQKPQGAYDHARAIAKADAARGYAVAADIFHFKLMQGMKSKGMKMK